MYTWRRNFDALHSAHYKKRTETEKTDVQNSRHLDQRKISWLPVLKYNIMA